MKDHQSKQLVHALRENITLWVNTQHAQKKNLQNFLYNISDQFRSLDIWKNSGDDEIEGLEEYLEHYTMKRTWEQYVTQVNSDHS